MSTMEQIQPALKSWGSVAEALEIIGCSQSTLHKMKRAGLLRSQKVAGFRPRLSLDDARRIASGILAPTPSDNA